MMKKAYVFLFVLLLIVPLFAVDSAKGSIGPSSPGFSSSTGPAGSAGSATVTACKPTGNCFQNIFTVITCEQGGTIGAVIIATGLLLAAAYMFGSFTSKVHLKIFAKDEAYHLFFTIVLLVSFAAIMGFSCTTVNFFMEATFDHLGVKSGSQCYKQGETTINIANCYLSHMKGKADSLAKSHVNNQINSMMDSSFSYNIAIPVMNSYTFTSGSYLRVHSQQYESIFSMFIMPALLSLNMQKIALNFIKENLVVWILPIAFVFRALFPLRPIGNVLIAFCIGLYLIVPFMYALNLAMYDAVFYDCKATVVGSLKFSDLACDFVADGESTCTPSSSYITCTNPNSFWNVAKLLPQSFFLPNLTMAVFITFMGAVNKALRVLG